MHVASGGFSGATQVALDLTRHAQAHECLLVLRRKRRTPMARVQAMRTAGVPVAMVNGWTHLSTIIELMRLCRHWRPDVVVGHGFPEHLLARWAGWASGIPLGDDGRGAHRPILVQVEHNMRERYSAFKRWQVRLLQGATAAFIGVSESVATVLRDMGLPPNRIHAIHNGIDLAAFDRSEDYPWPDREAAILMAARFGAQKDHETLIRALVPLRQVHGLHPKLRLAGGGSVRERKRMEALVTQLGLQEQVEFLGHRSDLPALLMRHRVAALSTHYEGLPLSLAEAMAAGCAVVGSDVAAVREILEAGRWGWLARHRDPAHWAEVLAPLLRREADQADGTSGHTTDADDAVTDARQTVGRPVSDRVAAGRTHAREHLNVQRMVRDHEGLIAQLHTHGLELAGAAVDGRTHDATDHQVRRLSSAHPAQGEPLISILMPAHNARPFIEEALGSILSQVDESVEVLVLDDGSTDGTGPWLDSTRHPQLRALRHEQAQGVSEARNALLEAARGTWLWFIDADDRLRAGALEEVRAATRVAGLDIILLDHSILRERPRLKHRLRGESHRTSFDGPSGQMISGPALLNGALRRAQWHPWGRVVRRAAWPAELRFPTGRTFEDLTVIPQLMAQCRAGWWIRRPLIDYRSSPTSILGSMNASKVGDWAKALRDLAKIKPEPAASASWLDHLAVQAVRLQAVAQRLEVEAALHRDWWQELQALHPNLPQVMGGWWREPRRWGLALKAHRLGLA